MRRFALALGLLVLAAAMPGRGVASDLPPTQAPPALAGKPLVLDAALSKETPYVGETVSYVLRLYRAVAATGIRLEPPAFSGVAVVAEPGQRDSEIEAGGRRYAVSEVLYRLTPRQPGHLAFGPAKAFVEGTPGRSGALTVFGPRLTATVRPLPPHAGDAPFTGLVGRLTLTGRLDSSRVAVGDTAVYALVLSGRGNLEAAALPPLPAPADLDVSPLSDDESGQPADTQTGQRTFRYRLHPLRPGSYVLPDMRLDVFDPESATYRTLVAAGQELTAVPAPALDPSLAPPLVHTGATSSRGLPSPALRAVLALVPMLLCALAWMWRRSRRRSAPTTPRSASPVALAEALRRALDAAGDDDAPGARHTAAATLAALDRALYGDAPGDAAALEEAAALAQKILKELP